MIPVKHIYLIDVTKSMAGKQEKGKNNGITGNLFDHIKKDLVKAISNECSVCEEDEIVIIPFASKTFDKIRGYGSDYNDIAEKIKKLTTISDKTNIDAAWMEGLNEFATNKINILYLLTDGIHNCGPNINTLYRHIENWEDNGNNFAFFFKMLSNDVSNTINSIASKKETMASVDYNSVDIAFLLMESQYKINLKRKNDWIVLSAKKTSCDPHLVSKIDDLSDVKLSLEDETNYTIESSYDVTLNDIYFKLVSKHSKPVSETNKLILNCDNPKVFCYPKQIDIQIDVNLIEITFSGDTPLERAYNYVSQRTTYTEEVDSTYIHDEIPNLENLSYEEIVEVTKALEGTPAFDYAVLLYLKARNKILDNVQYKFNKYVDNIEKNFDTLIVPMILQEVNDFLADDLEKVLEIYTGWGGFRIVHDADDLMGAWQQVIYKGKYNGIITKLMKDYDNEVLKFYKPYSSYCNVPSVGNFSASDFKIITPSDIISKYTEQQNSSTIKNVVINGGFLILDIATSGGTSWLHALVLAADAGQAAYDIYTVYSADATDEDKLIIGMVQAVDMQIIDYLQRSYHEYIRKQNKKIKRDIFSTLKKNEHNLNITDNWEPIEELEFNFYK